MYWENQKLRIMAENAQKQANITGKTFDIVENGEIIMSFYPEKKQDKIPFVPKTAEEQADDLKGLVKLLKVALNLGTIKR